MTEPRTIRWGILGTGAIAGAFARALTETEGSVLHAVGSRTPESAAAFAATHAAARAHGSYAQLAADPDVDAVYVATPHAFHLRDTLLALDAGKPALCEKAFALSAGQARRMVHAAAAHGLPLMEAMWTRFLPSTRFVLETIASGRLGEARALVADFGFRVPFDPASRLFDPALGGGALLDLGVYAVSLGHLLFGAPTAVGGTAALGATGVDESSTVALTHAGGRVTSALQSFRVATPCRASILCDGGSLVLHAPWWGASRVSVQPADGTPTTHDFPRPGEGYAPMAAAFAELVRTGRLESDGMPLADTVAVMETMDALRAIYGVAYADA
ncbi:MAG TPA: Gfo/Idh/MocA family oxidoreductase [Candidatus Krumholzibacteria bacterium]|nr:Gfo/Idh/MocA family oxidoreductase [Candidatus Krumholzibacteria bacterium]